MSVIRVALAGNPNCGKTTLFNALTGARHYVGNWAGVTVEKRSGFIEHKGHKLEIIDLPGAYSLTPNSLEEKIARDYILGGEADVIINIVDATALERNLYMTTQLAESQKPVVMALNMMDAVEKAGAKIDLEALSLELGLVIEPIVAVKKKGLDTLLDQVVSIAIDGFTPSKQKAVYSDPVEKAVSELMELVASRQNALRILDGDQAFAKQFRVDDAKYEALGHQLTNERYHRVAQIVDDVLFLTVKSYHRWSDKIDNFLLNPVLGIPFFILIMLGVFKLTFDIGNIGLDMIDVFFSDFVSVWASEGLQVLGVAQWLHDLIIDGIIGGVGGVLTFVPNITVMFIAISFLEDTGYMARVAFIMDKYLRRVGLNGKAFIPMILGFGCNVPAVMATRTLDNEKDRLITILINPFMSCGARFPVYILFAGAFFPGNEFWIITSLYFFGIVVALLAAWVLRKTVLKQEETHFIMEIPPYRLASLKALAIHVWDRVKGYIIKAGTVIFAASVILWFLLNFNFSGMVDMNESFGAMIGKGIAVFFLPLGFGSWQAGLSLLTGLVAKEVIIANMAIAFGFAEDVTASGFYTNMSAFFSPVAAYAFLIFVLLYTPCVAVIGAIKKETNSWKWTFFSVGYQLAIAWFFAFIVYQIGTLIWG